MCGLFLTGPESKSIFEEARSLEVLTPDLSKLYNHNQGSASVPSPTHYTK